MMDTQTILKVFPSLKKISAKKVDKDRKSDVYIVAKDFSWTYVRTHEDYLGPYLCVKK